MVCFVFVKHTYTLKHTRKHTKGSQKECLKLVFTIKTIGTFMGTHKTFVDDVTFIHWKKKKENVESIVKKPLHKMKLKLKSHTRKVKLQKENVCVED